MKMKFATFPLALALAAITAPIVGAQSSEQSGFPGGFPTAETVQKAYDDADLSRAIEAYKFFYPTVSFASVFAGLKQAGFEANRSAAVFQITPKQVIFTPNSDTPYTLIPLDLSAGPIVVELPAGQLLCVVNDLNQRFVMDLGVPGPDAGKGGKHLILPPGYKEQVPGGYFVGTATTFRVVLMLRAIPVGGDIERAIALMKSTKIHPLHAPANAPQLDWKSVDTAINMSPVPVEGSLKYWEVLHQVIEAEPPFEAYRMNYGQLATLGIEKGKPFAPDARMARILEDAARIANAQMRVGSFADRRPDAVAWPDRKWEWASLVPENGTFDTPNYKDLDARSKWFYQAVVESPAMFRRKVGSGSLYWLGARDRSGAYLDGGKSYKLTVPLPAPAKLFWSVTVYDPDSRSQIQTDQEKAALRSLFELKDKTGSSVDLYFGPTAPPGHEAEWIKTNPGKGWFVYLRLYGPEEPAFDGSWRPGDFEAVEEQQLQPTGRQRESRQPEQ